MGGGGGGGSFVGTRGSRFETTTLDALSGDRLMNMGAFALVDIDGSQVAIISRTTDGPITAKASSKWQFLLDRDGLSIVGAGVSAAKLLPKLKGMSVGGVKKTLTKHGFVEKLEDAGKFGQTVWYHSDGSRVMIHPYGGEKAIEPKGAASAHVHKEEPVDRKLNDRGVRDRSKSRNHIGLKNPMDYPTVKGQPHGYGLEKNKPAEAKKGKDDGESLGGISKGGVPVKGGGGSKGSGGGKGAGKNDSNVNGTKNNPGISGSKGGASNPGNKIAGSAGRSTLPPRSVNTRMSRGTGSGALVGSGSPFDIEEVVKSTPRAKFKAP